MEDAFDESRIDALAVDGYVVINNWLGRSGALGLRGDLILLQSGGCFVPARIGSGSQRQEAAVVRGDSICWFDASASADACNGRLGVVPGPRVALFLARMNVLREHLSRACFLSLASLECHAACYEPGSFYEEHLDTVGEDSRRVLSFSHYLSERALGDAGGCLRMHSDDSAPVDIEPMFDRLVVFRSRSMRHEVMPVVAQRLSMTGWMSTSARL